MQTEPATRTSELLERLDGARKKANDSFFLVPGYISALCDRSKAASARNVNSFNEDEALSFHFIEAKDSRSTDFYALTD